MDLLWPIIKFRCPLNGGHPNKNRRTVRSLAPYVFPLTMATTKRTTNDLDAICGCERPQATQAKQSDNILAELTLQNMSTPIVIMPLEHQATSMTY